MEALDLVAEEETHLVHPGLCSIGTERRQRQIRLESIEQLPLSRDVARFLDVAPRALPGRDRLSGDDLDPHGPIALQVPAHSDRRRTSSVAARNDDDHGNPCGP
jgi:hypothetical protein